MITHEELVEAGFEPQLPVGRFYVMKGWDPLPKVDNIDGPAAFGHIGAQQTFIRNKDDLDRFATKSIPTFCTLQ